MALFGRKKNPPVVEVVEQPPTLPPAPAPNEAGLRRVDDHRDYLLSLVEPLPPFGMHLLDALGLALCEDLNSPSPLPRVALSDVDGVAVRAADVAAATEDAPVELVVDTSAREGGLREGRACPVRAQGPVPQDADAVLLWPATDRGESKIKVFHAVAAGEHLRPAGADVPDDAPLAHAGQVLDDRTVALLAAVGIDKVMARPRPRVVVFSHGADLVEAGRPLGRDDDVHDATGVLIAAAAKQAGCQVWRVLTSSDDLDALRESLTDQLIRADLVITTGGPLDAENDVMRGLLEELGLCDFADVALRPGRRQGFALVGDDEVPVVMLPTHPVAAHVSFHAFVRPLLRKMAGAEKVVNTAVRGYTSAVVRSPAGLTSISRAVIRDEAGRQRVDVLPHTSSEQLSGLARSNALAVIEEDVEMVAPGGAVTCWLLDRD